jgi:hypothetical protein
VAGDEETSGVDNVLTVDNRLLRLAEGLATCTRVAFPMFAAIAPLFERILFGRLPSSAPTGLPNVDVDLEERGRSRAGSANGLPAALVSVSSSTSSALNAIRASGDRPGVA